MVINCCWSFYELCFKIIIVGHYLPMKQRGRKDVIENVFTSNMYYTVDLFSHRNAY